MPLISKSTATVEKTAERIASAEVIALILPNIPTLEIIGAAAALAYGLRQLKKVVNVFSPPKIFHGEFMPWQSLAEKEEPLREFIISFDLTRSPIKELKYERDENRLSIILSPQGPRIRREDVEFKYGALRYDLVIALGVARPEEAAVSVSEFPELLHEKPIVNIDASHHNTAFGEINLLASVGNPASTLAELIHQILTVLKAPLLDRHAASALLAALYSATKNFTAPQTGPRAFGLAAELLKLGADVQNVKLYLSPPTPLGETQLAARATARTRFDQKAGIMWSLLTGEDFAKSGVTPEVIPAVFAKVIALLPPARHHVLLWQDPEDGKVRSVVRTPGEGNGERNNDAAGHSGAAGTVTPAEEFQSFSAAEEGLAQLLSSRNALQ